MNMLWFGKDISQAVDDPRIHEEVVPKMDVEVENNKYYRLPEDIQDGLRALGHNVTVQVTLLLLWYKLSIEKLWKKFMQSLTQENLELPREANMFAPNCE